MDREHLPWMLVHLLMILPAVSGTGASLTDLAENVAGKLVFYQTEGNTTYVRDTGQLASDVPTETMFELFDPQRNFSAAKFTYTWDLGNGEVIQGTEPVVHYHYSKPGNYTLRLEVGVNTAQYAPPITGVYSKDVQVLDAIKNIELEGPSDYTVSQDSSLAFHVDGSPPMWVCWRFLKNCLPDLTAGCTLTMLYENSLELNHTFTSAGVHCLDISVRNDISKLQTSFSLYVRRNVGGANIGPPDVLFRSTPNNVDATAVEDHSHLLFILACAAILVATFSFILVITCRPWQQSKSQVAASSNAAFLKDQDSGGQSRIVFTFSSAEKGEREPLVLQHGTQYC